MTHRNQPKAHKRVVALLTPALSLLIVIFSGAAEASYSPDQPDHLSFIENGGVMGAFRMDAEFQKAFRGEWKKPACPLTQDASDCEEGLNPQGTGLAFGLQIKGLVHTMKDTCTVHNFALLDSTRFEPGTLDGDFTFGRGDLGVRFGLFTHRQIFNVRVGLFLTYLQIHGQVSGPLACTPFRAGVMGVGTELYLELAPLPMAPFIRLYGNFTSWSGESGGSWSGTSLEGGCKLRYMGMSFFCGYRQEVVEREGGPTQSDLKVKHYGLVCGLGLSL